MNTKTQAGAEGSTQPRRLMVMAHNSGRGGAEHCLDTTLRHLNQSHWSVTALFPREGAMSASARQIGLHVDIRQQIWWMAFQPGLWYLRRLFTAPVRIMSLARRMRSQRVDLVYSNTAVIPEGALAARLAGIPHVWHVHEVLTPSHMHPSLLPVRWITQLIAHWSTRVVFESHGARDVCAATVPDTKARVVYNSLRTLPDADDAPAGSLRASLDIAPEEFVVAWVGRFSERKHPLLLLEALARMTHRERTTLLFVGQGPLEHAITERQRELGLPDARCRVLPFREALAPVYRDADALALTSTEESFGLVLVEAGAFGLPVVATRSQGPTEIVVEGETGFLVEQGDSTALAATLDRLAGDRALRRKLGAAGAARAASHFSASANTAKLEDVFRESIG